MIPHPLIGELRAIVGPRHLLTGADKVARYTRGYRYGDGDVLAVTRPGTLIEQWRVISACVAANVIVLMQAANTGLTGGSTPDGSYDRPVVLVNTLRLTGVHLLDGGRQVVCLPGATLDGLERQLAPLRREPHSVIGSSCFGASVVGGVCNNSGGALLQRGPSYTELAVFAQQDADGTLRLVNRLGIRLPDAPEAMLATLESGDFALGDTAVSSARASAGDYVDRLRQIDAPTPARFNADPSYLHDASGSAGHLAVFAVRLDTFPMAARTHVFHLATNDPTRFTQLRRDVLGGFTHLPIAAEYMHRDAFRLADDYGRDLALAIDRLGTQRLGLLTTLQDRVTRLAARLRFLPPAWLDRVTLAAARLFPNRDARATISRYDHHLLIRCDDACAAELRPYLVANRPDHVAECTPDEGRRLFLRRFVAAGAAVRYKAIHAGKVAGMISLDIALPRNARDWFEVLPPAIAAQIDEAIYYGHFFCHVLHQDYIVRYGTDLAQLERDLLAWQESRGAKYPAEHNVGHLYPADAVLEEHYRALDPCNTFNPGVGKLPRGRSWHDRVLPEQRGRPRVA